MPPLGVHTMSSSLSGSPAPSGSGLLLSPLLGTPAHSSSLGGAAAKAPVPVARLALVGIEDGSAEDEAVRDHAASMGVAVHKCR